MPVSDPVPSEPQPPTWERRGPDSIYIHTNPGGHMADLTERRLIDALDAKDAEIARLRTALDALTEACRELSPSALPEKRHNIILARLGRGAQNTEWDRWWKEYPDGQLVAFAYRVFRIVNDFDGSGWTNTYEEPGEELP